MPAKRSNRMDDLAELVANGLTVDEAGHRMGLSVKQARATFHRIRAALGWQAK